MITTNQPWQHCLSQTTTPSTKSGHHWQCMAREHPFEGNYGDSTNTQSERHWKRTVGNAKWRTRRLCLSPRALANWFLSLTSNSDCCYHWLSVAMVLRSYSCHWPLAEKVVGWICKFSDRNEFFTRTSQQLLTGLHRSWTYFEQAGTNGTAHQLNPAMRGIYPLACNLRCSVIHFPSHSAHRTLGRAPL